MARSLTTASLRPSPLFPKDLCAFLTLRRPPASTLSLIPPSPPDPLEPPDPLDRLLVRNFAGVVSWPLLICFVSSLSPASQISKFLDLSSIPLVASLSALSPIVGSSWGALFAFRYSLIAVCRLYSGFDPAHVPTRYICPLKCPFWWKDLLYGRRSSAVKLGSLSHLYVIWVGGSRSSLKFPFSMELSVVMSHSHC